MLPIISHRRYSFFAFFAPRSFAFIAHYACKNRASRCSFRSFPNMTDGSSESASSDRLVRDKRAEIDFDRLILAPLELPVKIDKLVLRPCKTMLDKTAKVTYLQSPNYKQVLVFCYPGRTNKRNSQNFRGFSCKLETAKVSNNCARNSK